MEKAYNISKIKFDKDYLIIVINNQIAKFKLDHISEKLANANEQQRNDYQISPSGYGIHWKQLDEDLSINGLLKADKTISLQFL